MAGPTSYGAIEIKNLVIVEFPTLKEKVSEMEATLKVALVDTRAFDGCISVDVYLEEEPSIFTLIEDWESFEHYDKYIAWRTETGLGEMLDPLLNGWAGALKIRKFQYKDV